MFNDKKVKLVSSTCGVATKARFSQLAGRGLFTKIESAWNNHWLGGDKKYYAYKPETRNTRARAQWKSSMEQDPSSAIPAEQIAYRPSETNICDTLQMMIGIPCALYTMYKAKPIWKTAAAAVSTYN